MDLTRMFLSRRREYPYPFATLYILGPLLLDVHTLRCTGKLYSDAYGEDALELQPSPFDWNDTVGFVI